MNSFQHYAEAATEKLCPVSQLIASWDPLNLSAASNVGLPHIKLQATNDSFFVTFIGFCIAHLLEPALT